MTSLLATFVQRVPTKAFLNSVSQLANEWVPCISLFIQLGLFVTSTALPNVLTGL